MKRVLLLAGEQSGALYARQIAAALRTRMPEVEIRGYGDYGFEIGDLAVMGVVAVATHIGFFLRVRRTLERAIDEWRPDVVCTIDYPGMNMRLAAYAKSRGIRTVHVVCPQVWAWRQDRIPRVEASFDRLCCFLPFEPALFTPGFARFVGHPLAESFPPRPEGARTPSAHKLLAVLPGSRLGEIHHHLPTLLRAVVDLRRDFPDLEVVIPAAHEKAQRAIEGILAKQPEIRVAVQAGGARELLMRADAAVVASGTATLEAALARCPTVLVYKVDVLFATICRIVIRGVRHIGLANVIAEKSGVACPMPELLQENFTADAVVSHLRPWLTDAAAHADAVRGLDETMHLLKTEGTAIEQIADCLMS